MNAVIKPENVQVTRTQTQASASTKTLEEEMMTIFPIISISFGFQKTVNFNLLHYDFTWADPVSSAIAIRLPTCELKTIRVRKRVFSLFVEPLLKD